MRVRVGDGLEGLAADRQSMAWAGSAFTEGGLRQISADDTERALAGQVYNLSFAADDDALALGRRQTRAQRIFPPAARGAGRLVGDRPGLGDLEAFQRDLRAYGQVLETRYGATDNGVLGRDLAGLMHGGDRRWTFPAPADLDAETLDDLKGQLAHRRWLGRPHRGDRGRRHHRGQGHRRGRRHLRRPAPTARSACAALCRGAHDPAFPFPALAQPVVLTHTGRADQAIGLVAWPTDDFFADPVRARIDTILSDVMQLRLIDVLRLKEGVTYSPAARSNASLVWPHWGFISAAGQDSACRQASWMASSPTSPRSWRSCRRTM